MYIPTGEHHLHSLLELVSRKVGSGFRETSSRKMEIGISLIDEKYQPKYHIKFSWPLSKKKKQYEDFHKM